MSHPSVRTCILPNRGIDWEGEAPAEPLRHYARQEPRPPIVFQTSNDIGLMKKFLAFVLVMFVFSKAAFADDSTTKIREGMRLYSAEQYDEASKSFAAASESLEKAKSAKAAIAAFDEACALHRKGDLELARERYLKTGLSQDKGIATSAHFNIGVIASEQARKLAGEKPESIPVDKRKEILGAIGRSIDSYRHCLELQPQHSQARHNLELLRQWTKYYSDRWREADLQKRRDETNLIQFLEYLVQAQLSLKDAAEELGPNTSPNSFAELKRVQEELRDEIPYLKDKIDSELRPKEEDSKNSATHSISAQDKEDIERGIALLSTWADEAGTKMANVGKDLMKREATAAADNQQRAVDQLDQIWDAVVPFHPLLANELTQQTQIAKQLSPPTPNEEKKDLDESSENSEESDNLQPQPQPQPQQKLEVDDQDWSQLLKKQERVLRKARLLRPKAESELSQVESQPTAEQTANTTSPTESENADAKPKVDPEAIKAGYLKAIELAPKAVEEMEAAVKQLSKRERQLSATHAVESRRILQEIQDAQPKNPDQDQQDQNKDQDKDQPQDNEQKKDKDQEKDKKDEEGKDPKEEKNKNDEKKPDKQQDEKKDEDKKDKAKPSEKRQEPKISQDRIEEALRRVREREQEKRERDRELRARVLGRVPVDKDW